jgi:glutamyl-tRNA synthetase
MSAEEFTGYAMPYYKQAITEKELNWSKVTEILHQRVTKFNQIPEMIDFFNALPEYENDMFINKKSKTNLENAPVMLKAVTDKLTAMESWDKDSIHDCLINLATELEVKNGTVMWPARIAVAGKKVTPGGAVEILDILGREESLRRLNIGLEKLGV